MTTDGIRTHARNEPRMYKALKDRYEICGIKFLAHIFQNLVCRTFSFSKTQRRTLPLAIAGINILLILKLLKKKYLLPPLLFCDSSVKILIY